MDTSILYSPSGIMYGLTAFVMGMAFFYFEVWSRFQTEKYLSLHILFYGWHSFFKRISKMTRNHSDTFVTFKKYIWFGPSMYVPLNEQFIHRIYSREGINYRRVKCTPTHPMNFQYSVLGSGAEEEWKTQRENLRGYFSNKVFMFDGTFDKTKEVMMKHFNEWAAESNGIEGGVDLCYSFVKLLVSIRAEAWLDMKFTNKAEYPRFARAYYESLDHIVQGKNFSRTHLNWFHDKIAEGFKKSVNRVQNNEVDGFLAQLSELYDDGVLSSRILMGNISLLTWAVTPAFPAFWCTIQLFLRPNFLAKARKDDNFLKMCVKETMRLYPPVPIQMERECIKDDKIGRVTIKKGSVMLMSSFYIHHNQNLWVEWAEWNPYRWKENYNLTSFKTTDDDNEGRLKKSAKAQPRQSQLLFQPRKSQVIKNPGSEPVKKRFLPFGGGRHQCMGMQLGKTEAFELVKMFINNFDLELMDDKGLFNLPQEERVIFAGYSKPVLDPCVKVTPYVPQPEIVANDD